MRIENLETWPAGSVFDADIVIIGGGPAGLTVASAFIGQKTRVLVLESGLEEEQAPWSSLNRLESDGEPSSAAAKTFRKNFHGPNIASFDPDVQPFGVRARVFGGAVKYWGGKSATFDDIDFASRPWVPGSGWPISRDALKPYFERAARILNLGPNIYDEGLWDVIGLKVKRPAIDRSRLRSFFWQFARSRFDGAEMMSFAHEFRSHESENIRTLVNATVTCIETDRSGGAFESLEVSTLDGRRSTVRARACVLAAGGIENARLLLASRRQHPAGLGNAHDVVGRYLMDHPGTRIGQFNKKDLRAAGYLGFYTIQSDGRPIMSAHGLSLSPELQAQEHLLNAAIYVMPEIAKDDPIEALKRLVRMRSRNPAADAWALVTGAGLLSLSLAIKAFRSKLTPKALQNFTIDVMMRVNPAFVVREFQSKGVPHKLEGMGIHIITEQQPDPASRIVLADAMDRLGVPLARACWKIGEPERRTVVRFGQLLHEELIKAGMPTPDMADWIREDRPQDAPLVDSAHIIGTTRMSDDPRTGVVDADCQVHGVSGLYIAGSSVFPTSGHANPTLMIVALSIRLADRLKEILAGARIDGLRSERLAEAFPGGDKP